MDMWTEQWTRVERWFVRFNETNSGRIHDRESDYCQDEAYAFFQNCHHLKDWLKNDATVAGRIGDVESLISSSDNLKLCADLCNGSKHLKLMKPRASADTKIGNRQFSLHLSSAFGSSTDEPPTISAKYEVQSGGSTYDAFAVAEACMKEWRLYLKGHGLL